MADKLGEIFSTITDALNTAVWAAEIPGLGMPWLVVLLLGVGVFLTLRMTFIQFRKLRHAVKIVRGDYDNPEHAGDISHFQALTTALSATVGIGNIAGVAMAIHYGGPGAIFWMWITALLGMCTKYTEVSLAMKYRDFDAAGNSSGGPQKYILKGLGQRWKPLAYFFALCAVLSSLGAGNMNQINTLAQAVHGTMGVDDRVTGAICAVLVGFVILGGIRRIGQVTGILAPFMACVYVLGALVVLAINFREVPAAFVTIVENAFNPTSGIAGTAAGAWSMTLLWGVKRGLFSNEAGQGSAPIAHAAAKTDHPLREGLVALLEPFIDTIIICTMTALVIVASGLWDKHVDETHVLDHKGMTVMTWATEGASTVGLVEFGEAMGLRDGPQTIENLGLTNPQAAGAAGDPEPVAEVLEIENGRPVRARHHDGSTSGVVLVKNHGPVVFGSDAQRITLDRVPWTGELKVQDGVLKFDPKDDVEKELAKKLKISAGMIEIGQDVTATAFANALGGFGRFIVTITVILFALSTAISWSYYGDRCTEFLFGIRGVIVYKLVFLGFVYLGAVLPLETVWTFGDVALGLMTVPNLIAIVFLSGKVRRMQDEYFDELKQNP